LAGGAAVYHAKLSTQARRDQEVIEVITVGQRLLRDSILAGRAAVFCSHNETAVDAFPDGKVRVSGCVDLIGQDGKPDRRSFSVVLYRDAANSWVGEALSVTPKIL
jgi:hypothetical protein